MDAIYLAAVVVAVISIVILIAVRRRHSTAEKPRPYQCLTVHMNWGNDTPTDDRIKRILSERAARLEGQRSSPTGDEANSEVVEIFCGNRFHRDR